MYIIAMLLLISLLILIHEAGHFFAARFFGIRVNKFGFGLPFGPTLFEKKIGDVTYCIHACLLGGYVSFPDDDPESDIPLDDPARLKNKPIWQRTIVISAGVIANMIAAFVIVLIVSLCVGGVPSDKENIFIKSFSTSILLAKEAGFKPNDQILSINGVKVTSFYDFKKILMANKANDGYVSDIDTRNQLKNIIKANPNYFKEQISDTLNPTDEEIQQLENKKIALDTKITVPKAITGEAYIPNLKDPFAKINPLPDKAKLTEQDTALLKSINQNKDTFIGDGITSLSKISRIAADNNKMLLITVLRQGKKVTIPISPDSNGVLGVAIDIKDIYNPITSPIQLIGDTWNYVSNKTVLMSMGLYKILSGQIDLRDLHGIVAITKVGGETIEKKGFVDGWLLTALISIDLAIVNLLPIPALDGGHLMFLLLEKLRGRPVEEKYQEAFSQYGFLFLIGCMILILFNDIVALVTNKF